MSLIANIQMNASMPVMMNRPITVLLPEIRLTAMAISDTASRITPA